MKKIVMIVFLIGVVFAVFTFFNKNIAEETFNNTIIETPSPTAAPKIEQGSITVINTDAETLLPIPGTIYTITNSDTSVIVETLTTDAAGKARSGLLDYGTSYLIRQQEIMMPYQLVDEDIHVDINAPNQEFTMNNQMPEHVKKTVRTEDGRIVIKKVYIDVPTVMQKPELPNGCEITSLTAVLNYYGYEATKTQMSDTYLPKRAFSSKDGKLYGPDPYQYYAGEPRDLKGGFFSFAPPIVDAANLYFDAVGRSNSTADISGSTREQIMDQLNAGIPVVMWITLDLTPPKMNYGWNYNDTGEYHIAPVNLHVAVINGYEDNKVHVMNPLEGQVTYDADTFFNSYEEMGSHAMIVGS
ncbi:C39 family peptidase [Paenibacillus sp. sgz302251]|uniref:C39 family peptidase n=1 Tax=Paenibacillus sp. sgz302251 TaxID=3414493 RepID=UPI003C7B5524